MDEKKGGLFSGIILLSLLIVTGCDQQSPQRPNILFISLDDLNDWIEPLGGHPQANHPKSAKVSLINQLYLPMPTVQVPHAIPPERLSCPDWLHIAQGFIQITRIGGR